MGKKNKKQTSFGDKGSSFSHSGVNLFAQFSSSEPSNATRYNPDASYTQQDFLDLKNLFQKCFKKSDHTKIKSLTTILSLLQSREDKSLFIDQLPNWVALFCRLLKFEQDKQVRTTLLDVQRAFLRAFKKDFYPYITDIFTPMWNSMFDLSIEVSTFAKEVFYETFPEDRHTKVLGKCQEAYIREVNANFAATEQNISDEDLPAQIKQEIFDRLVAASLLGLLSALELNQRGEDKEGLLRLVEDLVADGEYAGPKVWDFLNPEKYRNKVRSAAVELLSGFVTCTPFLPRDKLAPVLPLLLRRLTDQDRFVSQSLWKVAMPRLLELTPPCLDLVDNKGLAKEVLNCVKGGGYGAGTPLFTCMLKLCSQLDPSVFSHTYIRDLYTAFMLALSNDDSKAYSHALIMAYYEVFLLLYIKKQADREWFKQWALVPIETFMKTEDTGPLHSIPSGFSRALLYLDGKGIPFEVWGMLYELLQNYLLRQLRPACVEFLELVTSKTMGGAFRGKSQLEDLIENTFGVFSHDIEALFSSPKPNLEAIPALRVYDMFLSKFSKLLSYRPQLITWWTHMMSKLTPSDAPILALLASILQKYPDQWFEVVLALGNSGSEEYAQRLLALVPRQASEGLVEVGKSEGFQSIPMSLADTLATTESNGTIESVSEALLVVSQSGLLSQFTIERMDDRLRRVVSARAADPSVTHLKAVIGAANVLVTRTDLKSVEILSTILVSNFNQTDPKTDALVESLWSIVAASGICAQVVDLASSLFRAALHGHSGATSPSHMRICRHLLEMADSPIALLEKVMLDEGFFSRCFAEDFIWSLFDEMTAMRKISLKEMICTEGGLKHPWLIAELQGVDFCPSLLLQYELRHRLVVYKEANVGAVLADMMDNHRSGDILQVLMVLISKAVGRQAYSKVVWSTIKIVLQGTERRESPLSTEELAEIFSRLVGFISSIPGAQVSLIEVAKLFKSRLSASPVFTSTVAQWRASASESPQQLAIYGSSLPETITAADEADIALLSLPLTRGFHPFDFVYALAVARRYGFPAFNELMPVYESEALTAIQSNDQESLLTVLPYVQRLLGSPELITEKRQLSDCIVSLARRFVACKSEHLMLELAEVVARMHSIVDDRLDEEGLFFVLEQCYHDAVLRAVFHLLQFSYQNGILTRVRTEAASGDPIPPSALRLLDHIPEIRADTEMHMDPRTLGFVLGWLLVLSKYQTEKFHLEKKQENSENDFTVCVKTLLEGKEEVVTVFLTSLFAFFPEHVAHSSLLKPELSIGLVDLFDEQSCGELACFALYTFLKTFPALARSWWNHSEKRLSALVLKFVTKVLSSHMYSSEIENIENRRVEWQCAELELRTSRAGRDITAHYAKEEVRVEIELRPPESYPLQPVNLVIRTLVKLSEAKIRGWELRLNKLFNNENASVLEAILMWKANVDRELEGIEHCTICYYIVHVSDKSLPTMACKVCKNKFHGACIRKWFQTSNKNNCPLCQNHFWG